MTDVQDLKRANDEAQAAFHDMIVADVQSDPDHPFTRAYVAAERRQDDVLRNLQWEKAKTELDRLQTADLEELARGDHFAGMPRVQVYEGMD